MAAELQRRKKKLPFSFLFPRSSSQSFLPSPAQLPLFKPATKLAPLRTGQDMSSIPQPTVLYPQPLSASAHSNGSYGPVFAVLAAIAVLSVAACIVARLCARRICQPSAGTDKGDVENRFDFSGFPAGKLARHGVRSEAAWHGGKKGEGAAKHAEINGAKSGGYVGGSAGAARASA
ncbi:uncharacterized protein LOC110034758 [Phalaenopsis equestris]|uniref:uncharacterized protein LOC110034758 n=1 Tax=Phalaenopsis equestris TaxID=78828 RepID=UPI0009E2673D|nr:uncharacterized protein LOC110034758 [Phalaenopsis equestris]